MNKKALILHWMIIFGFLVAIGVFLYFSQVTDLKLEPKGQWQVDFLNNYYYPSQNDLLTLDLLAKQIAGETIFQIALNGGFQNKIPCKHIDTPAKDYVLWNKKKDFASCTPQITKEYIARLTQNLNKKYPERKYHSIQLKKNIITAKANQKSITSQKTNKYYTNYSYNTGFEINLGFDLNTEYLSLRKIANNLVAACNKKSNLESCLKENIKKENTKKEKTFSWKLFDCTKEKFHSSGRKVAFCVESKNKLSDENKQLTPIKHHFALDFTTQTS